MDQKKLRIWDTFYAVCGRSSNNISTDIMTVMLLNVLHLFDLHSNCYKIILNYCIGISHIIK